MSGVWCAAVGCGRAFSALAWLGLECSHDCVLCLPAQQDVSDLILGRSTSAPYSLRPCSGRSLHACRGPAADLSLPVCVCRLGRLTKKDLMMTTGTPAAVRMRSLICALTSVSPATCTLLASLCAAQLSLVR